MNTRIVAPVVLTAVLVPLTVALGIRTSSGAVRVLVVGAALFAGLFALAVAGWRLQR